MTVNIFFCYAHEDEPLLNKLKSHLKPLQRQGFIDVWHDRDINAGTEWEQEINRNLNEAQIILLLVSSDFMASDYCYGIEMKRALERHKRKEAHVIPIILRPVDWKVTPLGELQVLPDEGRPITEWRDSDEAFFNVAQHIRQAIKQVTTQSEAPSAGPNSQKSEKNALEPKPSSGMATIKPGLFNGSPIRYIGLVVLIIAVIVGSVGIIVAMRIAADNARASSFIAATATARSIANVYATAAAATATAIEVKDPYTPTNGKLAFDDSLSRPYQWDDSSSGEIICQFSNGAYHVSALKPPHFGSCQEQIPFSNFAFEVQMTIIQGDCGGIIFRSNDTVINFYYFEVCQNGFYSLYLYRDNTNSKTLVSKSSPAITAGLNQLNTIAVVAYGSTLDLYVNHTKVDSVSDSTYTNAGFIALDANAYSTPTEVAYSNAKVWTL